MTHLSVPRCHRSAEDDDGKHQKDAEPWVARKDRGKDGRDAYTKIQNDKRLALGAQLVSDHAPDRQKDQAGYIDHGKANAHLRVGKALILHKYRYKAARTNHCPEECFQCGKECKAIIQFASHVVPSSFP